MQRGGIVIITSMSMIVLVIFLGTRKCLNSSNFNFHMDMGWVHRSRLERERSFREHRLFTSFHAEALKHAQSHQHTQTAPAPPSAPPTCSPRLCLGYRSVSCVPGPWTKKGQEEGWGRSRAQNVAYVAMISWGLVLGWSYWSARSWLVVLPLGGGQLH